MLHRSRCFIGSTYEASREVKPMEHLERSVGTFDELAIIHPSLTKQVVKGPQRRPEGEIANVHHQPARQMRQLHPTGRVTQVFAHQKASRSERVCCGLHWTRIRSWATSQSFRIRGTDATSPQHERGRLASKSTSGPRKVTARIRCSVCGKMHAGGAAAC